LAGGGPAACKYRDAGWACQLGACWRAGCEPLVDVPLFFDYSYQAAIQAVSLPAIGRKLSVGLQRGSCRLSFSACAGGRESPVSASGACRALLRDYAGWPSLGPIKGDG
jgi:hypothetical protein